MRILFVNQYFPPETEPSAAKIHDLAGKLAEKGCQTTVITGFPNYPSGVIPPAYRGKFYQTEVHGKLKVLRTYLIPSPNRGFLRRTLNQISFMLSASLRGFPIERPDVVVTSSPPLEVGLVGYLLSRIKRMPFVFEVRDAWPAAAVIVGVLRNPAWIALAEAMERFLYRQAARIIVVTEGVQAHVVSCGVAADKTVLIPNGADTDLFHPGQREDGFRTELGLKGKFVVLYAGTHGLQAGLSSVLQVVEQLQRCRDIVFLFVGDGAEKGDLQRQGREKGLGNALFLKSQPREKLAQFLALADVGIVHTRKHPFFEGYRPVKMLEYMAAGCPVILGANGESKMIIEKANAGIWVGPENPSAMAQAIMTIYENPELGRQMGENGREYALMHFSRKILVRKYQKVLTEVVQEKFEV